MVLAQPHECASGTDDLDCAAGDRAKSKLLLTQDSQTLPALFIHEMKRPLAGDRENSEASGTERTEK